MDVSAKVTAKGQVTIPKSVRDALGIGEGDRLLFRVFADRALLARTPDLLELAGSIAVPRDVRGASWNRIVTETHHARARERVGR